MSKHIKINKTLKQFNKKIQIEGDKSLSIRWALLASQAKGTSICSNLLKSHDVLSTLNCLKKLGTKVYFRNDRCFIKGSGLNGFNYKKNLTLDAGNSGTLARLIMGLLIKADKKIKIVGDKSLSKRDFTRVIKPLSKFGAKFKSNLGKLPILIKGSANPTKINYYENIGSAQCKSAVMLAALNSTGETIIKAKKSRDHTELLFKHLNIPIKTYKNTNFDIIKVRKIEEFKAFNYKVPSDISSSAFFIVLTALSKNSKLIIKNVNINPTRTGCVEILNKMGAKILFKNIKHYKGEKIADIYVKSATSIKPINCPIRYNSSAIDEFLLIFLVAAKAKGISYFKNLNELNQKESPRLDWGSRILNLMGIRTELKKDSIKIFGNPSLKINRKITIKNYLKDHRIFMTSVIAAHIFGGEWVIHDKDSIKTSFPTFLKTIKNFK